MFGRDSATIGRTLGPSVWASLDEGATWGHETALQEGLAQYSVMSVLDDGSVGVAFETSRDGAGGIGLSIRFLRFPLSELGL